MNTTNLFTRYNKLPYRLAMRNTRIGNTKWMILGVILLFPFLVSAQYDYRQYFDTKVMEGLAVEHPWIGGLNGIQYGQIDLNNDNELDLVAYDRSSKITHCFLKVADMYTYAPEYNHIFPKEIYNFMQLIDYNQDGKQDLFTAGNLGLVVYENVSIGESFNWRKISSFISYESVSGNEINLQLAFNDYPYLGDIDKDGDIDILSFNTNGLESSIIFYKNNSVELTGIPDMSPIKLENNRWGNFEECQCNQFAFDTDNCRGNRTYPTNGNRLHIGGKSVFIADLNKDNLLELITSHQECNAVYNFSGALPGINPKYTDFSSIFPENTETVAFDYYPNTMMLKDDNGTPAALVVSPNLETQLGIAVNFIQSNWYYQIDESGIASLQTKAFLQEDMIDLGIQSSPALWDFDKDGDLDLLVAYTDTFESSLFSGINLYENTGSSTIPLYELIDDDYLSFANTDYTNLLLQIKDINLDGIPDLAFQATENGQNKLLIQTGNSTGFDAPITIEGVFIGFGYSFHFTQVTGSESIDLFIGKSSGGLILYENIGSANQFRYNKVTDNYLSISDNFFKSGIKVYAVDMDENQQDDLIVTDQSGLIKIYSDYKLGSESFDSIAIYNSRQEDFIKNTFGSGNTIVAAPIYNSSYPSLIIGGISGGLRILRNKLEYTASTGAEMELFTIYPNPNNIGFVNLRVTEASILTISSASGRIISDNLSLAKGLNSIPTKTLTPGLYLFTVQLTSGQLISKKLLIY
ncbi:MAG: hypothetical protein ACJAT1_000897 [Marivirga sp.]